MRSKAPLAMMEQMLMLLVFALAAVLCLQAFTKSEALSSRSGNRDRAAELVQSTLETVRHCGGGTDSALRSAGERLGYRHENNLLQADYDSAWELCSSGVYHLTVQAVPSGVPGLNQVRAAVEADGEVLFSLDVAWQGEVDTHGA
nr:hypothetical protein [uncultured Oscillibacter sp.]